MWGLHDLYDVTTRPYWLNNIYVSYDVTSTKSLSEITQSDVCVVKLDQYSKRDKNLCG